MDEILNSLLEISSPSGFEKSIQKKFQELIVPFVDRVSEDCIGNVVAYKKGRSCRSLMIIAHADEVGLMITHIDENGFLYFKPIGAIDVSILPGIYLNVLGIHQNIIGVIGKKPVHLLRENQSNVKVEDLWIDIGAANYTEATKLVEIGTVATFLSTPHVLNKSCVLSKSLDDRVGLYILLCLAKEISSCAIDYDLYLVSSTQEELGSRGAQIVSSKIKPDYCITIDVTHATDYPSCSPIREGSTSLGKGPALMVSPDVYRPLYNQLVDVARRKKIPFQIEVSPYPSGTDGRIVQLSSFEIKTAVLGIPCRYMHTPVEMISKIDIENSIHLLFEWIRR